jgi:hypothetical protein
VHWQSDALTIKLDLIRTKLDLIRTKLDFIRTKLDFIRTKLDLIRLIMLAAYFCQSPLIIGREYLNNDECKPVFLPFHINKSRIHMMRQTDKLGDHADVLSPLCTAGKIPKVTKLRIQTYLKTING